MLPRHRLASTQFLYDEVSDLAASLDEGGMDLWAANLRGCLHGATSSEAMAHLSLELHRLHRSPAARRLRLRDRVDGLIGTVEAAIGRTDGEQLPVYMTLRDLADLLELEGGRRWLVRLRTAGQATGRSASERMRELADVLAQMRPGERGVPPGGSACVTAVRNRLSRVADPAHVVGCIDFALRPPA